MEFLEQFKNYRKIDQKELFNKIKLLPFDVYYLNEKTKSYVLLAKQNKAMERQENSDWEALQKEYLSSKVDISTYTNPNED